MITEQQKLRQQQIIERAFFPVEKVEIGMGRYAIINRETGDKLSEVSQRYTLVKNQDVFAPFVKEFGIENVKSFYGYGNRKYYYMSINTGRQFNFGTDENPDLIDERIIIQNSYNKTRSFSFMVGAFRFVCSNGLYSGQAILNYKKIHVGEIPVQKMVFETMLRYTDNSFETWKRFKNVPLTVEQELKIVEGFEMKDLSEEKQADSYNVNIRVRQQARRLIEKNESVDNQRNGWGLMNQINRAVANVLYGNSKTSERITANRKLEDYLVKTILN